MPQTRMFRDRVVSMEQTLEGGEKHLDLLKSLCREAFPEFEYRSHGLDHERDLFVMTLESPDGRAKTVGWTRMVLFDAERVPALSADAAHALRARVIGFLRSRATRSEVVVTFRHLEEGWVDTPEARRDRRRRRGRGGEGRVARAQPPGSPPQAQKQGHPHPPGRHAPRGAPGTGARPSAASPSPADRRSEPGGRAASAGTPPAAAGEAVKAEGQRPSGGRRRRFRRRRRGRGGPGSPGPAGAAPAGPAGGS